MTARQDSTLTRHRVLSLAIAGACFAPAIALADNQQVADGINLSIPTGSYTTSDAGAHVLWAKNGGVITADGPVNLASVGGAASDAMANGVGSRITLSGGVYSTTGNSSHALVAQNGGMLSVSGDAAGTNAAIATSGIAAHGAWISGAGSLLDLDHASISTYGSGSAGAVVQQGSLSLSNSNIVSSDGRGVDLSYSGMATIADSTIATIGNSGNAIEVNNATVQVSHGVISTQGSGSAGLHSISGGRSTIDNTRLQTQGAGSYGLSFDRGSTSLDADGIDIITHGDYADAIAALGSAGTVDAKNITLLTTGYNAVGVDNRGAAISLGDGTIQTLGDSAYGLYASKENNSDTTIAANNLQIHTQGAASYGAFARQGSSISLSESTLSTQGDGALGGFVTDHGSLSLTGVKLQTEGANAAGIIAQGDAAQATIADSTLVTRGDGAYGVRASNGAVASLTGTTIDTGGAQAWAGVVDGAGSQLTIHESSLGATQSGALFANGGTTITAEKATLIGGNRILLGISQSATDPLLFTLDNSSAVGDITWSDFNGERQVVDVPAVATVKLDNDSTWTGATHAINDLTLQGGSLWAMTADSTVGQLTNNNSAIAFQAPVAGSYKTLNVGGNFAGSGGVIAMNTQMNAGGLLSNQQTDRLLIQGDVTTTGTTYLKVTPQGAGALTDTNHNGIIDASEGISLVQVAGRSRVDAFALQGGYLVIGPWQYTLHAFGSGQASTDQNALPAGELNWDYRLGNKYADDGGGDNGDNGNGDGGGNDSGNGGDNGDGGGEDGTQPDVDINKPYVPPAVAPQLPSYIVAPTALLHYSEQMVDTLQQRLGEIRNVPPSSDIGGEVFARYIGGEQRYTSDLSSHQPGYGFDQQINAWQIGGSLMGWDADTSSLRAGWAFDKGTTHVRPKERAIDGASDANYNAYGVSGWLTWQQQNGFYVDTVVGGERYNGKVTVAGRGYESTVRAHGWTASLEAGYPFGIGRGWSIEPQAQLSYQSLRFQDILDNDGTLTQIAPVGQTTSRLGVRLAKTDNARLAPYVRLDAINTSGGRAKITASDATYGTGIRQTFQGGRVGSNYRVGAGLTSQLTRNVALYGEADYLGDLGVHGFSGWSANAGVRINF